MSFHPRFRDDCTDFLFEAILSLETAEECYRFFHDLCTVNEIRAMAQRWHTAAMLNAGFTYDEITEATGVSTATISRIKRFLQYGADGYALVLKRLGDAATAGMKARHDPAGGQNKSEEQ